MKKNLPFLQASELPVRANPKEMQRTVVFALAPLLALVASSAAQTVANEQLSILRDLANEWPALKALSVNLWDDPNIENACKPGMDSFALRTNHNLVGSELIAQPTFFVKSSVFFKGRIRCISRYAN